MSRLREDDSARRGLLARHRREAGLCVTIVLLGAFVAAFAPGYFSLENLNDLALANLPVLIVAIGMTLVVLVGEIDISVGSAFAVCGVAAGVIAKLGAPIPVVIAAACALGAVLGLLNGTLVALVRIPSIVVTLAMMVALRDGLRWITQGAWVQDLPSAFQWFGLTQGAYPWIAGAIAVLLQIAVVWTMRNVAGARTVYATGSNQEAARIAGIDTQRVKICVFAVAGALTGLAAVVNAVRFNQIPSNSGLGLEMKVIAAVVVGGAAIRGGSGTFAGTLLGVVLLGAIGPALTFLGVSAYWERAIQGAIILAAVALDALRLRSGRAALRRRARGTAPA